MQYFPSPDGPLGPELSIDPVIGWRLWRLERDAHGRLWLVSPMRSHRWQPLETGRAMCQVVRHAVPAPGCMCGFYATGALGRLPMAAGLVGASGCGVVGSVALWGRVVEHALGYRAEFAYPDRLRLVCGVCFGESRVGAPLRVIRASSSLLPVCGRHASDAVGARELLPDDPSALESELLSTYAIDRLPADSLVAAGFSSGPPPPSNFREEAEVEFTELRRSGFGKVGLLALVLAFLVLRSLGAFSSASSDGGGPWTGMRPTPVAQPIGGTTADHPRFAEPAPRERDTVQPPIVPVFPAAVCGELEGTTIELRRCGSKAGDVFGTAVSPPEHRSDCVFGTGFTRRNRFSVCWVGPLELILDEIEELQIWQLPRVQYEEVFG